MWPNQATLSELGFTEVYNQMKKHAGSRSRPPIFVLIIILTTFVISLGIIDAFASSLDNGNGSTQGAYPSSFNLFLPVVMKEFQPNGSSTPIPTSVVTDTPMPAATATAASTATWTPTPVPTNTPTPAPTLTPTATPIGGAPSNDNFASAIPLTISLDGTPVTGTGTTAGASMENFEPQAGCTGDITATVWYKFTPSADAALSVGLTSTLPSSIELYRDAYTPAGSYQTPMSGCGMTSSNGQILFPGLLGGQTYYLRVGNYWGDALPWPSGVPFTYTMSLIPTAPTAVNFAGAIPLTVTLNSPVVTSNDSSSLPGAPVPGGCPNPVYVMAWYRVAISDPAASLYVGLNGDNSMLYDIAAWSLYTGSDPSTLARIAGSPAGQDNFIQAAPGQYYLEVSDCSFLGSSGGSFYTLDLSEVPAAPGNDSFASAIPISLTTSMPVPGMGTTVGASVENQEPKPSCNNSITDSVWYAINPATSGLLRVQVAHGLATVYSGSALGNLIELACGTNNASTNVTGGQTYYLQVAKGAPSFYYSLMLIPPPANDNFANAASLTVSHGITTTVAGDTTAATREPGEPTPSYSDGQVTYSMNNHTVWYSFTPSASGTLDINSNASYENIAQLYTGPDLGSLTPYAGGLNSLSSVTVNSGQTYYLQFAGVSDAGVGPFNLTLFLH